MEDALTKLQAHLESIIAKLVEVREEVINEGNPFRIVPLSHQDSGCVLAVCEPGFVDLIPMTPFDGSIFLTKEQLDQLNDAMEELAKPKTMTDKKRFFVAEPGDLSPPDADLQEWHEWEVGGSTNQEHICLTDSKRNAELIRDALEKFHTTTL